MKLSTRLLLPLLAAVAGVMVVYSFWAVRQREDTLTREARSETHVYARTLGLAMEAAFRSAVLICVGLLAAGGLPVPAVQAAHDHARGVDLPDDLKPNVKACPSSQTSPPGGGWGDRHAMRSSSRQGVQVDILEEW